MNKKRVAFILITIFYMAGICFFSLRPGSSGHGEGMATQIFWNFLHIPVYGILAYLVLRCFSVVNLKAYSASFIIAVLFGAFNEFLQSFVPFRTVSLMDIILNGIGVAAALFFRMTIWHL